MKSCATPAGQDPEALHTLCVVEPLPQGLMFGGFLPLLGDVGGEEEDLGGVAVRRGDDPDLVPARIPLALGHERLGLPRLEALCDRLLGQRERARCDEVLGAHPDHLIHRQVRRQLVDPAEAEVRPNHRDVVREVLRQEAVALFALGELLLRSMPHRIVAGDQQRQPLAGRVVERENLGGHLPGFTVASHDRGLVVPAIAALQAAVDLGESSLATIPDHELVDLLADDLVGRTGDGAGEVPNAAFGVEHEEKEL